MVNGLDWAPKNKKDVVPPDKDLTNENLEDFLLDVWEHCEKPSVLQAKKWVNHALTHYGRPPLNRYHRQQYASVLDLLAGMEKENAWKKHRPKGALPLKKEIVKQIFEAALTDPETQELSLVRLRNKSLAVLLIVNGWHPIDAYRVTDNTVEDHADFKDRCGTHRPKFVFFGEETKFPIPARNTVGCGCLHAHNPRSDRCFYNIIKWYTTKKEESDKDFFKNQMRHLSQDQRAAHLDDDGKLKKIRFFRGAKRNRPTFCHSDMGINKIRQVLEFWNRTLDLKQSKLTTNMARKTFCTLSDRYTATILRLF